MYLEGVARTVRTSCDNTPLVNIGNTCTSVCARAHTHTALVQLVAVHAALWPASGGLWWATFALVCLDQRPKPQFQCSPLTVFR